MTIDTPKVSVIIPTYYRNERLKEAIDSVSRTKYDPLEVIVVDDSGEKHAKSVIEENYDVRYVPLEENRGQNAALNRGLQEISGRYVQFLDDDDEVLPGKFRKQTSLLESSPDVGVAYCGIRNNDGELILPAAEGRGNVLEQVLTFSLTSVTSAMLFDRPCLERVKPLPTPTGSTDIYMKIELAQITEFEFVNEALIRKGNSTDSVGSSAAAIEGNRAVFDIYEEIYDGFDSSVQQTALAKFYNRAGRYYTSEALWSPWAITAFSKALYYEPGISVPYLGRLVGSIFGRPGVNAVERGMSLVTTWGN